MTNRENLAWKFTSADYSNAEIAQIISDIFCETHVYYLDKSDEDIICNWLGRNSDLE